MSYGHAESYDLLRNRERSVPYGHAALTELQFSERNNSDFKQPKSKKL